MDSNELLLKELLSYDDNQKQYNQLLKEYKKSILNIKHSFSITQELLESIDTEEKQLEFYKHPENVEKEKMEESGWAFERFVRHLMHFHHKSFYYKESWLVRTEASAFAQNLRIKYHIKFFKNWKKLNPNKRFDHCRMLPGYTDEQIQNL
ncbi:hypothetical protein RBH94_15155 [Aestuariibaculum sp. YM273]|uniref:hypothetical protein n=1 Tax=Aestuariibaculum sp. YM273 TaxID=3070659 RepID=UPI0027DE1D39|nr:hypothetical protein [Aestuariibaculum sp. YM273]WMI65389.1 hypothetical protein RBH94_15155 [Aestuariibaculum sp. YM273]